MPACFPYSPILGLDAGVRFSPQVIFAPLLKSQVLFSRCESLKLACPLSHREILIIQSQILYVNNRHCRMELYFQQWATKSLKTSNWIAKTLQRRAGQCDIVPFKTVYPLLVFLFLKTGFIFLAAMLFSVTAVSLLWLFRLRHLFKILCHEAPEFSAV